jgi:hypothetical protein
MKTTSLIADAIDVVIPAGEKDYHKLVHCIKGILENSLTPIRSVYIVAPGSINIKALQGYKQLVLVDESVFPFSKASIAALLEERGSGNNHAAWYFQQLIKMYVFEALPKISPNVLILDADYTFRKKVSFVENGKALMAYGYPFEWLLNTAAYPAEVSHVHAMFARQWIRGWEPQNSYSGMQHHMLFQKHIMEHLFHAVEQRHRKPVWRSLIDNIMLQKWNAASEYVMYFHFAMRHHPDAICARHLHACDIVYDALEEDQGIMQEYLALIQDSPFVSVGCHAFTGFTERIRTSDYMPDGLKRRILSLRRNAFKLTLDRGVLQFHEMGPEHAAGNLLVAPRM